MIRNVRKAYVDNIKSNAFSSRDLAYMFYIRDRCATGPSIFLRGDVQDVWRVPAFGTLGKELGYEKPPYFWGCMYEVSALIFLVIFR